jgi:hypothetical protein
MVETRAKNKQARPALPDIPEARIQKELTGKTKKLVIKDAKATKDAKRSVALQSIATIEKATMEQYANNETPHPPPKSRHSRRLYKRGQRSPSHHEQVDLPSEPATEFPYDSPMKKGHLETSESELTELEDTVKKKRPEKARVRDEIDRMIVDQENAMDVDLENEEVEDDNSPLKSKGELKRMRAAGESVSYSVSR